jgi:hypothetical protein
MRPSPHARVYVLTLIKSPFSFNEKGDPHEQPLRVAMSGPPAAVAAGFRDELLERGHRPGTVAEQLQLMAHVSRWLAAHDLEPYALARQQIEQFVRERRGSHAQPASARELEPLLAYLRGLGVVPPAGSREAPTPAARCLIATPGTCGSSAG